MTEFALKTENPLRKLWESGTAFPNPKKETITLQIGENSVKVLYFLSSNLNLFQIKEIQHFSETFPCPKRVYKL